MTVYLKGLACAPRAVPLPSALHLGKNATKSPFTIAGTNSAFHWQLLGKQKLLEYAVLV